MTWELSPVATFERHRGIWDELNARSVASPVLDSRFITPLLAHFGTGRETLAHYRSREGTQAMTILQRPRAGLWTTIQPSQAPLGAWVSDNPTHTSTLALELLNTLPGVPLVLGITQQDPDITVRPADTPRARTLDYVRTARITVAGTFGDYWAARGKNLRQNLKRQRNRLSRAGIATRLDVINEPGLIPPAVAEYGRIESSGWKIATGTAIHPENAQGRFYSDMLTDFAQTGSSLIFRYYYNDQVVAMDLCIVGGGALVILKTTYDESQTTTSPAMLMRQESFNHIFERGDIRTIEFYGKVMDWHTKWSSEHRTLYHLNFYRWGLLGHMHNPARSAPD